MTVFAQASVSLDGFISGPAETGFDRLFAWCTAGDVPTPSADPDRLTFRTSAATASYLQAMIADTGAVIVGRRLFDMTKGWGGQHPMGAPVFVVTNKPPTGWTNSDTNFTFVTDGVHSAVEQAKEAADAKNVGIGPGSTVWQALRSGLIDELRVDLVPEVLGGGVRMIDQTGPAPLGFGTPEVIQGIGVTHLIYRRG